MVDREGETVVDRQRGRDGGRQTERERVVDREGGRGRQTERERRW